MSSVEPVGSISKILSLLAPPKTLTTIQKRCLIMLAFSTTGIAMIIWYYRRKQRKKYSKMSSRSKSADTTTLGADTTKEGVWNRPVKQVDPRVPVTPGKQTNSVRSLTEDEKRSLRRRNGRSSRASSFDRTSFSSIRSAKVSAEESMQPLGELNLDHYNEVLNTFQSELEKAISQSAKKTTSHFGGGASKRTAMSTASTLQSPVSFSNVLASSQHSFGVNGPSVNNSSDCGSSSFSQSHVAQIHSPRSVIQQSSALHPGSTPVNSQELIIKLQKLLDLASELQQKEMDKESQESNTLVAELAILEDPVGEEDVIEQTAVHQLKNYSRNSRNYVRECESDDSEGDDDSSSTLSFCSVSEFPTSPFVEDEFQSTGSHANTNNYSTPTSNPVLSKFSSFSPGGERNSIFGRKISSSSGLTSPKSTSNSDSHPHAQFLLTENGVSRSAVGRGTGASFNDVTRSSVYSSGGELPSSSFYTGAFNTATISSPVSDPFLSAIGSPVGYSAAAAQHPVVTQMLLYEQGLNAVNEDAVPYRVLRTELLNLGSDSEFLAKLFGIRKALSVILGNISNKDFLKEAGKTLVSDFLLCCNQTPSDFQTAFDEIVRFCADDDNWPLIEDELSNRGVVEMNFFDIVIDFIFLDAFDDLENPPSSIVNVLQNRWLSQSFKETALRTAVWSVLKAKRARLRYPDGFINRFYSISEVMSPLFAYGFLGPPGDLQDLCLFFKFGATHQYLRVPSPSLTKMTYTLDHCFMGMQAALYLMAATGAFCVLVPLGVVKADFVGHCLLFGELSYGNNNDQVVVDDWGSDSTCSYVSWINAVVLCFGVFLGAYLMAMCCTGRETFGLEATCCSPFPVQIFIHSALSLLTFAAACFVAAGLANLCESIDETTNPYHDYKCGDMAGVDWQDPLIRDSNGQFYDFLHAVRTSCWFVFFMVTIILFIYMARWYNEKLHHAVAEQRPIIDSSTL